MPSKTATKKRKPIQPSEGFVFDAVNHVYTLDGKPLHGVTKVLGVVNKPALIPWAANVACDYTKDNAIRFIGNEWTEEERLTGLKVVLEEARVAHIGKKEAAGEAGTDAHSMIETIIKSAIEHSNGYITIEDSGTKNQVDTFIKWARENKVKFYASELRLYSKEWWVAGTCDMVCELDGKLYIGDLKTSRSIYPTYHLQTAAYAKMAVEMNLYPKFDGTLIVNTPSHGGITIQQNYDLEGNTKAFEGALVLYKQLRAIDPKYN